MHVDAALVPWIINYLTVGCCKAVEPRGSLRGQSCFPFCSHSIHQNSDTAHGPAICRCCHRLYLKRSGVYKCGGHLCGLVRTKSPELNVTKTMSLDFRSPKPNQHHGHRGGHWNGPKTMIHCTRKVRVACTSQGHSDLLIYSILLGLKLRLTHTFNLSKRFILVECIPGALGMRKEIHPEIILE